MSRGLETKRIGAMIVRGVPPSEVVAHARALEDLYDELWVVEDLPYAGGISQAAAVLAATSEVEVGHGIAPAAFRNPAALAMEWASLAEIFPGRFRVGIGHGVQSWMAQIGEAVDSPMTLLGETISVVKALIAGETVDFNGRYVQLDKVTLKYPPKLPTRVLAGVVGPKSLRLAGALADGTIIGEGHGPEEIRRALEQITAGRAEAGRSDHHYLTVFAAFYVGQPEGLGQPSPDAVRGWEAVGPTVGIVTEKLATLFEAGADTVVLVPLGQNPEEQLLVAGEKIVPALGCR